MKVVLFCGGLGTRLREHSDTIPKPLVQVGARPILWHVMKYYAHYGHTEFVLCLGYRGDLIRQFFMNYDPRDATDFVMDRGVTKLVSGGSDVSDWRIHFVDTGPQSNIGERLTAVKHIVGNDEVFLANYSDQLTDLPLDTYAAWFAQCGAIASFVAVKPSQSFHLADIDAAGSVQHLRSVQDTETWINGGYMILKREIFDHMEEEMNWLKRRFEG